jgi:hydrogenase nickel incorporation protein HypA/HybF
MHEFSICQSMVNIALAELKKLGKPKSRLLKMHIVIGKLHAIIDDNLRTAYEVLTRNTQAQGSELKLKTVPIIAECQDCGYHSKIRDSLFFCKRCKSVKLGIIKGRELYIEKLEVAYDEEG